MRLTSSPSPITAATVALAGVSFSNLRSHENSLFFDCRDPENAGKSCVKSISAVGEIALHTRLSSNVRSAVHEYGGGSFAVAPHGEGVIYTDFPSHNVYWSKSATEEPTLIFQHRACRLADLSVTKSSPPLLLAVMEDHSDPEPSKVKNSIVTVSLDGLGTLTTLASGHDFYASPQLHSDLSKLAFVAWDHPNMPWDHTTLYIQTLNDMNPVGEPFPIHGHEQSVSVAEPRWTVDGGLCFLSDLNGWYNLYKWEAGVPDIKNLCVKEADFATGSQGWILGLSPYEILPDGTIVCSYTPRSVDEATDDDGEDAGAKLVLITSEANEVTLREFGRTCIPPTSISSFCATSSSGLYFVGGSATDPPAIWHWGRPGDETCVAQKVLPSMDPQKVDLTPLQQVMSRPRLVKFPSHVPGGVGYAYGYYYPPSNLSPDLGDEFKPPLLVKAHGGPTSQTSAILRLDLQFWTSRGFAVLDVDYGGSTGYGKEFRQSLQKKWGIVDVADVCNGAKWCVEQGWANGDWLCIDGRSAGGYTTLAALTFQNVFAAGASLYGISDLASLYTDTHKFESRYMDGLVGPYPEKKSIYDERCPINFIENLNCPVILLQGDEDNVVPPNQAETMFEVLKSKGLPTSLVMYKGEQHGFRKSENIRHALNSEYNFFCKIFGFEAQAEDGFNGIEIGERIEI